jgi:hypothetical protein
MAIAIKRAPVLKGKFARDFYKILEQSSAKESKAEIEAIQKKWNSFLSGQNVTIFKF